MKNLLCCFFTLLTQNAWQDQYVQLQNLYIDLKNQQIQGLEGLLDEQVSDICSLDRHAHFHNPNWEAQGMLLYNASRMGMLMSYAAQCRNWLTIGSLKPCVRQK
jgi:hypothetical protein